jgi:primosomal protein N' (replication factor Y)
MAIAKVEPLTTSRALRGPFDYRLPDRLSQVGVGSVLVVPFGRRRVIGVVVDVAESSELPPERLVEPVEALAAGAGPELVRLGLWVARQYCSTPARGLELVLPPGVGRAGDGPGPRLQVHAAATPAGRAALADGTRLGSRQRAVLQALARLPETDAEIPSDELPPQARADHGTLRRLRDRGLVQLGFSRSFRRPAVPAVGAQSRRPPLSRQQGEALDAIVAAMDGSSPRELLLHGVTGSGKTEVYLAATAAALERGKGTIVLVPEIALTPQTVSRFAGRFGDRVALLHSQLAAGERRDEWERLQSGEARVCVGPRSAIFAPVRDLGLVVVDEEHDASYKQEADPRYDARAVARHRAEGARAALVAGTATPRPESWLALGRLQLPCRADGADLPPVEVLDARFGAGGTPTPRRAAEAAIHPRVTEALVEVREARAKAIVLLNRRGWSRFLSCRSCGHAWCCPQCDVALVLHRHEERLRCHHCGHAEGVSDSCPQCGSVTLARHGVGTERLASLLDQAVAPLPVFRLDSDTTARAGGHLAVLRRFGEAESGVLVGTQMVAKGHDFPDVVLSVVLDADATLRFPDFRAEERTFALVAQLAGRSGRGPQGGRVLVQTLAPQAASIRHAAAHDAEGFLAGELERRRALRYPPFSHLVRIELASPDAARVEALAAKARDALAEGLSPDADVLGPAPRFRVRARHRRQLLLKSQRRGETVAVVRDVVEGLAASRELRGVSVSVDVDPQ